MIHRRDLNTAGGSTPPASTPQLLALLDLADAAAILADLADTVDPDAPMPADLAAQLADADLPADLAAAVGERWRTRAIALEASDQLAADLRRWASALDLLVKLEAV